MGSSLKIGRILGISIQLHYSLFIVFAIFTYVFAMNAPEHEPVWLRVGTGIFTSALLFLSVLAHELAHSIVAIRFGIPVKNITLFILGGMARISREASKPRTEFLIAIAGPLCSLVMAATLSLVWYMVWGRTGVSLADAFDNPIFWLAWINLALAAFNLIPGFPLDGGRVLRSLIWHKTRSYRKASRIAYLSGLVFAYLLIGVGITILAASFLDGVADPFHGLWMMFVGWFLRWAAISSHRQSEMRSALQGFTARSVMHRGFLTVPPHLTIRNLLQDWSFMGGLHYILVYDDGKVLGSVNHADIRALPPTSWDMTTVIDIMVPLKKMQFAGPDDEAIHLLEIMEEQEVGQLPIIKNGDVLGVVYRENLLRLMELRPGLNV